MAAPKPHPGHPKGIIFDIKRFAIHDGPGIRTTVFFKGCPLRCAWCQNPEGMNPQPETLYYEHLCTGCGACLEACPTVAHTIEDGQHAFNRDLCTADGLCAKACRSDALRLAGREVRVDEVLEAVLRDKVFYETSGGGVTLSGGEPLMQGEFAAALLAAAKASGLHTALDTSGFASWEEFERVLPLVDLFLYDIKDTDEHRHLRYTGVELDGILNNLKSLDAAGAKILLRCPIVPGVNHTEEHIGRLAELAGSLSGIVGMERLAYHTLGLAKWRALGRGPSATDFSRPV